MKVLSLGWGVQSWTLAAMVAVGELEPIDYAIHADTTWESSHTYAFVAKWTPWLIERGVNVQTVKAGNTNPIRNYSNDETGPYQGSAIPVFTVGQDGKRGQLRRQCTQDWKVAPIRRFLQSHRNGERVEQWLGISLDEMGRAGQSEVKYVTHRYPLLERRMDRQDCEDWLMRNGLPIPPKSACVFCPYRDRPTWEQSRLEGGMDWLTSVAMDNDVRDVRAPYLSFIHPKRIPLEMAVDEIGLTVRSSEFMEPTDDKECNSGHCFL